MIPVNAAPVRNCPMENSFIDTSGRRPRRVTLASHRANKVSNAPERTTVNGTTESPPGDTAIPKIENSFVDLHQP